MQYMQNVIVVKYCLTGVLRINIERQNIHVSRTLVRICYGAAAD